MGRKGKSIDKFMAIATSDYFVRILKAVILVANRHCELFYFVKISFLLAFCRKDSDMKIESSEKPI